MFVFLSRAFLHRRSGPPDGLHGEPERLALTFDSPPLPPVTLQGHQGEQRIEIPLSAGIVEATLVAENAAGGARVPAWTRRRAALRSVEIQQEKRTAPIVAGAMRCATSFTVGSLNGLTHAGQ